MTRHTLNDTAAQSLTALMRMHGINDAALARAAGKNRTWVEARRNGRSRLNLEDIEALARALDLPATVFLMEPTEAVRYSLDNPTEQGIRQIIWEVGHFLAPEQLVLGWVALGA